MIQGKEEGFARKRMARDKANKRWAKNRHLVLPSLLGLAAVGGLAGGTITMSLAVELAIYGISVGAALALALGGPAVIRALCE